MTIRNLTLSLLFLIASAGVSDAQNYGYIHRDSILKSVPNYLPKLQELSSDQKKYSAEVKQGMDDLQRRVSDLLKPYKPVAKESISGIKSRMSGMDTVKLNLLLDEEKSLGILINYSSKNKNQKINQKIQLNDPTYKKSAANVSFIGAGNYASRVLIPAFKNAGVNLVPYNIVGSTKGKVDVSLSISSIKNDESFLF